MGWELECEIVSRKERNQFILQVSVWFYSFMLQVQVNLILYEALAGFKVIQESN